MASKRFDQLQPGINALPETVSAPEYTGNSRSALVHRVMLFQFKLFADGLRDLLLSPLSLAAGLLGILFAPRNPHCFFDRLLGAGRKSERWINLFDGHSQGEQPPDSGTLDDVARQFEEALRKDYRQNGATAKAARKFEDLLAEFKRRNGSSSSP